MKVPADKVSDLFVPGWEDIPVSKEDVEWTRRTIENVKIGGVWMVPRTAVMLNRVSETKLRFVKPMAHKDIDELDQQGEMLAIYAHAIEAGFEFEEDII